MSGLFIAVLNLSFSAGCVALLVMLARLALKKAPKIYSYALWAVVFLRFVCPFTISLPVGNLPVQAQSIPYDIGFSQNPAIGSGLPAVDRVVNAALEAVRPPAAQVISVNPMQVLLEVGAWVWLAGILALLVYGGVSYLRLKGRMRMAIRVADGIYEAEGVATPFVLGLLRPKIYLPVGLAGAERDYVLSHERAHIRRRDYLIKPLAFLVAAVHWFNPLAWVSCALMTRDMELSADERVMKDAAEDIRGDYSRALLTLSARKSGLISPLAFGETGVRARVKNVLHYKKPAFWVAVVAVIAVAAVSLVLMTGRQAEPTRDPPSAPDVPGVVQSPGPVSPSPAASTSPADPYQYVRVEIIRTPKGEGQAEASYEVVDAAIAKRINDAFRGATYTGKTVDFQGDNIQEYVVRIYNESGSSGYSQGLYYDTIHDRAYLPKDGEIDVDAARFIISLVESDSISPVEDAAAAALFAEHGWTLDYLISGAANKLDGMNALGGFTPNAYYFAYNNELSKDIGLDMSAYDGGEIWVDIYHVYEPMPEEFYPIQDCRGIVVKSGGEMIGAFIAAGRHSAFNACSLKGNSFETVTGGTVGAWLSGKLKGYDGEADLAKLTPEQVIERYFTALNDKDEVAARDCVSRESLLGRLTSNMDDRWLFNEGPALPLVDSRGGKSVFDNLISAELVKIEPVEGRSDEFSVTVDLQYKEEHSIDSGEQWWGCSMVYESPETGWKIREFGH